MINAIQIQQHSSRVRIIFHWDFASILGEISVCGASKVIKCLSRSQFWRSTASELDVRRPSSFEGRRKWPRRRHSIMALCTASWHHAQHHGILHSANWMLCVDNSQQLTVRTLRVFSTRTISGNCTHTRFSSFRVQLIHRETPTASPWDNNTVTSCERTTQGSGWGTGMDWDRSTGLLVDPKVGRVIRTIMWRFMTIFIMHESRFVSAGATDNSLTTEAPDNWLTTVFSVVSCRYGDAAFFDNSRISSLTLP